MARIEIDLKEYQELKDKVQEYEKSYYDEVDKTNELEGKVSDLENDLEYITKEVTFLDRVFRWKKVLSYLESI